MRVLVCWAETSGYMSACWRALAKQVGVELFIIAMQPGVLTPRQAPYADEVVEGLNCRLLTAEQRDDEQVIAELALRHQPDVILLSGWFHRPYRRLAFHPALARARLIMMMDNPLTYSWRQRLARLKIGRYLDRMDRVFVAGERCWQLARYLKVAESKIRRGTYGIDYESLAGLHEQRAQDSQGWPRSFLFAGRYAATKGIDVLLSAYREYRESVDRPWPLRCCGAGPFRDVIAAEVGVTDLGFVQPADMRGVWLESGAFVLASRFDPWPLVIVEACAAGLPVICTEACGSAVELVRPYFNGMIVNRGDGHTLARAMRWTHLNHHLLPVMGGRGRDLAAAYSAEMWAQRVWGALEELCP